MQIRVKIFKGLMLIPLIVGFCFFILGFVVKIIPAESSDIDVALILNLIFSGIGLILILIPVLIMFFKWRKKCLYKKLYKNGYCINANVMSVNINKNVSVNDVNPYYLVCQAYTPHGQLVLKSVNDYSGYIQNYCPAIVSVYIDRANPKKYFIDLPLTV